MWLYSFITKRLVSTIQLFIHSSVQRWRSPSVCHGDQRWITPTITSGQELWVTSWMPAAEMSLPRWEAWPSLREGEELRAEQLLLHIRRSQLKWPLYPSGMLQTRGDQDTLEWRCLAHLGMTGDPPRRAGGSVRGEGTLPQPWTTLRPPQTTLSGGLVFP